MADDEVYLWKGDFNAEQTRDMARSGAAMHDGSYPIPDADHLTKAIRAVGRGTNNSHAAIRKHIISRAKTLGLSSKIPDDWGADGSIAKTESVEKASPLLLDKAQQIVYGVVLTPGVEDSQGDVISAEEIEKAAHRWLTEFRKQDVQHSEVAKDEQGRPIAEPVESFCAPCDLTIEGEPVRKGAWVIATRVNDPQAWDDVVNGRRTGFSIGGSGVRQAIDAA
jgi:hypothetical protein